MTAHIDKSPSLESMDMQLAVDKLRLVMLQVAADDSEAVGHINCSTPLLPCFHPKGPARLFDLPEL